MKNSEDSLTNYFNEKNRTYTKKMLRDRKDEN